MLQFFRDINNLDRFKNNNILSYFNKKEKTSLLSIDIGSSQIKAVEISKKDSKLYLEKYYIIPLPRGCMEGHQIKNREEIIKALATFVEENNYVDHDTSLVISGPQIVTQVIKVPDKFADNQLLTHIELEAEKYLPFDVDDLSIDFDVLDTGEEEEGYLEILLAAAKKGYVNEFIDILETVGLNLRVVDVYSCVMGRLASHVASKQLQQDITDKVITMIDIGHDILTLTIFKNDRQIYIKEQSLGGKDLNDLIRQEHHIGYEQAEELKLRPEDPIIAKIIDEFREKIVKQVYHMLQFFYASAFGDKIDYIFLLGGVSSIDNLSEALAQKLDIPVSVLDPFKLIEIDHENLNQDFDESSNLPAKLSAVCGLGIRSYVE